MIKLVIKIVSIAILLLATAACENSQMPAPTGDATAPSQVIETPAAPTVPPSMTTAPSSTPETPGYRDLSFSLDGQPIQLVNGIAEVEAAPGSATKVVTQYFGNEALGDLNGDGKEDAVFLVTQQPGGSGTFFYVVAALRTETGYQSTNALLLGDRIAPQTTTITDGIVTVNYADRNPGEPFSAEPSVGVSKSFSVSGSMLVENDAAGQLTNRTWKWVSTLMGDGSTTTPRDPSAFTITLDQNGQVTGTTDCNDFSGRYTTGEGGLLSFDQFVQTEMFCEASQEGEFLSKLQEVQSYMFADGKLVLMIKYDSGTLTFE